MFLYRNHFLKTKTLPRKTLSNIMSVKICIFLTVKEIKCHYLIAYKKIEMSWFHRQSIFNMETVLKLINTDNTNVLLSKYFGI